VKRDPALVRLSWDHHHGLVMALRIEREVPGAADEDLKVLYGDLLRFWLAGLRPHFHAENDCLLARLARHAGLADELVTRTTLDHLSMARLVADMKDADGDIERIRNLLLAFGAALRTHIRWEESVLFERVQALFMPVEMAALAADLQDVLPPVEPAPRRS
jgi:hemerythrin-like domain-containing protein